MKTQCGIYEIRNTINGKCYYGSTNNWARRKSVHEWGLIHNKHKNAILQRAWNKYGKDAFQFNFLLEVFPEYLLFVEQIYLNNNFKDGKKIGYNIIPQAGRPPSTKGIKLTYEARKNISEGHKGIKQTIETIEKRRKINTGKTRSIESRKKMSEAQKGKHQSLEHIQKRCDKTRGMKRSIESKTRMSEVQKVAQLGKTLTEDHKRKISEALKRRYQATLINNTAS